MKVSQNTWFANKGWENKFSTEDSNADLVLYFGSRAILEGTEHFDELKAKFPNAALVGCSTGGEIIGEQVNDNSLVLSAIKFDQTQIRVASTQIKTAEGSQKAGEELGAQLKGPDLKGVLLFSDGTLVNGTALVQGLAKVLGANVPVTGGLAGDGAAFESTLVSAGEQPKAGCIAAIGFYGDSVQLGSSSFGGWDPFGPERMITKSKDNVLYELDGQPALDLYKKYLGDAAKDLPGSALLFPLTVRNPETNNHSIVRTILAVDEDQKSMTFAGDIPQGYIAQLMRGNFDHLVDGASTAAQNVPTSAATSDQLAVLVSCIGRKLLLGQRIGDEVEAVSAALGNNVHTIGFYSYGEICPQEQNGFSALHNQTMTITTIGEKH